MTLQRRSDRRPGAEAEACRHLLRSRAHRPAPPVGSRDGKERLLLAALGLTGGAAVVGGLLLVVRPDGTLLAANDAALSRTPFEDWRAPGVLLALLVGGGGLAAAVLTAVKAPLRSQVCVAYGTGLVAFEVVEWVWIGPQPLEVIFAVVGACIAGLALSGRRRAHG